MFVGKPISSLGGARSIGPGGHICRLIAQRKLPCKLRATHTHTNTQADWSGNCFFIMYHHCEHEVPEAKKRMPKEMRRREKNKLASDPNLEMTSYAAFGRVASAGPMISGKRSL